MLLKFSEVPSFVPLLISLFRMISNGQLQACIKLEGVTYGTKNLWPLSLLIYTMTKKTSNLSKACSFPEINHQSVVDADLVLDNFPAPAI